MNQTEALAATKALLPELADGLRLARMHSIGVEFGHLDEFHIWNHTNGVCEILAHSDHSWEHAISLLKPEQIIKNTAPDHSDLDAEIQQLGAF
jgi:hypothetical protein